MLWDRREALVEEKFEAVVVRAHQEATSPEIRTPMTDGVDEADQFPFVGSEGTVSRRDGPAEVGDWVFLQDEHCPETVGRRIALDDERLVEVRQGQNRSRGDRDFEGLECRDGVGGPAEPFLL